MFADSVNPSAEGIWTRVAPYLALTAIVAAFCLALAVVISAIQTSQYLTTKLPQESRTTERSAIMQDALPRSLTFASPK